MLFKVNSTLLSPVDTSETKNMSDMKNRSKSLACLSRSPTNSIQSSNSSANIKSCYSTSSSQKRFHSSHLGRPPGLTTTTNPPASNHTKPMTTQSSIPPKIAPLKEVEKMISDLKKENFDLKLKLYHLEELILKDLDMYQLHEENYRLRLELEDKNKRMEALEQELSFIAEKPTMSKATQTTTFESSPEAFNLLPATQTQSWQKIKANEDHLSSVVHALQKIKIDTHVETWLNQTVTDHQQGNLRRPCI